MGAYVSSLTETSLPTTVTKDSRVAGVTSLRHTDCVTGPRSAIVVNPSKVPDLDDFRSTVESGLADAGWPGPAWFETTPEDPGRGQAERAVADGAELVFACGGD